MPGQLEPTHFLGHTSPTLNAIPTSQHASSMLPFHRKPRDRAKAIWESQGTTGCWQNQPCLLSEPFFLLSHVLSRETSPLLLVAGVISSLLEGKRFFPWKGCLRTERGLSGKREIIKEKSKGFLRIKHLLWPQSCQQLSAQDGVGHPEGERGGYSITLQSVNTHGMPKDKVSSGQSVFTARSPRKGWNLSGPKVSASPAVSPHSSTMPCKGPEHTQRPQTQPDGAAGFAQGTGTFP